MTSVCMTRKTIRLVLLCLICSVGIVALAGCAKSGKSATSYSGLRETQGNRSAAMEYAVFRGPRDAQDNLPAGLIPKRIARALHLDLGASRYARIWDKGRFYLVPSAKLTCLVGENDAVGSCWPTATVTAGLATTTTLCGPGLKPGTVATFGMVPDGVSTVTILRTNVPNRTVPVQGNVFVGLTSSQPPLPMRVAWLQDGQRVVHPTGIPPRVAREGC